LAIKHAMQSTFGGASSGGHDGSGEESWARGAIARGRAKSISKG